MSTGSIPTEDGPNGSVRRRHDTSSGAPSLPAELVFRELIEAEAALTEPELRERTLLPEAEVCEAVSELESRGLCDVRRRRTDYAPPRYVATFPPDAEA